MAKIKITNKWFTFRNFFVKASESNEVSKNFDPGWKLLLKQIHKIF